MANWHFGTKRNWYLNFGHYVGFMTNAPETATNFDVKKSFNTRDAGLAYGIGVKIPLSQKLKLSFEFAEEDEKIDLLKKSTNKNIFTARRSVNIGLYFNLK